MATAVLPFRLGDTWLAFDAHQVLEVVGAVGWLPIPGAPSRAPGVVHWQGKAIALVDLGACVLGQSALAGASPQRLIVVRSARCALAVPAQQVREVQAVGEYRLQPLVASALPFTAGEVQVDGRTLPLVDVEALVGALLGAAP
ncbi:MAG: chemotaxis protein CheW [Myxococcales bacterium]